MFYLKLMSKGHGGAYVQSIRFSQSEFGAERMKTASLTGGSWSHRVREKTLSSLLISDAPTGLSIDAPADLSTAALADSSTAAPVDSSSVDCAGTVQLVSTT